MSAKDLLNQNLICIHIFEQAALESNDLVLAELLVTAASKHSEINLSVTRNELDAGSSERCIVIFNLFTVLNLSDF